MIKRNLIKGFAIGLCMSAVFAGKAYAETGAGVSSASAGVESVEDKELLEKQKELDQYLFFDHVRDIEKKNFKVIYTGVADDYVEVGITPYSDENAEYLYSIFGKDLVKIVSAEEAVALTEPYVAPDTPVSSSDVEYSIMDFGGNAYDSNIVSDEEILKERELMDESDEEFNIQIESIDADEVAQMEAEDERIRQGSVAEGIASEEAAKNIAVTSAHDDAVRTNSADNEETKKNSLPTSAIIAIVAGGLVVLGGSYLATNKKKTIKNEK